MFYSMICWVLGMLVVTSAFRFEPFQPTTVEFTASNTTTAMGSPLTLTCVVTNPIPGMAGYISFFKYDPHYDEFIEFAVNGVLTMALPRFNTTIEKTPSVHFTQYTTTLVINDTIVEDSGLYVCGSMVYNIYANLDILVEAQPPNDGPTFDFTKDISMPWVGDTIIMYCKAKNLLPGHYITIQKYSPSLGEFTDINMESGRYQIEFYTSHSDTPIQADSTPDRVNWVPAANRPNPPPTASPVPPTNQEVPSMPDVPSLPNVPSMPNIPSVPSLPSVPNVNVETPMVPNRPGVLDVPNYVPNQGSSVPSQGPPNQGVPSQNAPNQGIPNQGIPNQGVPNQGIPNQGIPNQGVPNQGVPNQGIPNQGVPNQGVPNQGVPNQGVPNQGVPNQGVPNQGVPNQGIPNQGVPNQGIPNQGIPNQGFPNLGVPNFYPGNQYPPNQYPPNQFGTQVKRQYPQAFPGPVSYSEEVPPAEASEEMVLMPVEFNLKFIIFDAHPQDSGVYHCGAPGAGVYDTLVLNVG